MFPDTDHSAHTLATLPTRRSAVAGVIMAAGLSGRFGRNKLLEPFRGRPLLQWTVEAALRSRLLSVTVVLGHEQERIRCALADLAGDARLSVVFNPAYRDGQSRSVVAGLSALPSGSSAAMFLVGDQPLLDHHAIDRLIGAFEAAGSNGICYPLCAERRANPVIFASRFFPALARLRGDGGGRVVIDDNRAACVPVEFVSDVAFRDVDHPADLDRIEDTAQAGGTNLVQALGLETSRVISLCGSGGKTSLMAALMLDFARDPAERLLATTTTKMGLDERDGFGCALQAESAADILAMTQDSRGPFLAYRRLDCERERLRGFAPGVIDDLARSGRFTRILVEADGSRRRPLKAPNADEPVFPATTETVIAVVGLCGLGHPLREETVFRSDRWSALTGLTPGDPVTAESLAQMITHPDGLMRQVPSKARRIVFLNQADGPDQVAMAERVLDALARRGVATPIRVVVAHLKPQPCLHAIKMINIKKHDDRGSENNEAGRMSAESG
jgi:probable selenium-dependent hydroxylase accessory protein YqeC